jgi:hypothetical protein
MEGDDTRRREQGEPLRRAVEAGVLQDTTRGSIVELSGRFGMTDKQASRELHRALDQCLRENLLDDPR